jgi:hypothetical protein
MKRANTDGRSGCCCSYCEQARPLLHISHLNRRDIQGTEVYILRLVVCTGHNILSYNRVCTLRRVKKPYNLSRLPCPLSKLAECIVPVSSHKELPRLISTSGYQDAESSAFHIVSRNILISQPLTGIFMLAVFKVLNSRSRVL